MPQEADARLHAPASAPDLAEREVAVLTEMAREGDAWVAFQGLRRRLELHQQALTRTLHRLEGAGLVTRDERGYRLTEDGYAALRGRPVAGPRHETLTVVQALLPPHVDAEAVAEQLQRRWFRGLRWHSLSEAPGETTLTWLTETENARVRVRIAGAALALEIEAPPGDHRRRFAAARAVLAALAEVYGLGDADDARGGVATLGAGTGYAA